MMGIAEDRAAARAAQTPAPAPLARPGPFPGPPGYVPIPPVMGGPVPTVEGQERTGLVVPSVPLPAPAGMTGGPAAAFASTLPRGASAGFVDLSAENPRAVRARQDYPIAAALGDIAGSIPTTVGGGSLMSRGLNRATAAATGVPGTTMRPWLQAPIIAGTEGAIYGAGYSPEDRARGATIGGLGGAALGAGGQAAVSTGTRLLGRARGRGGESPAEMEVREAIEYDTGAEGPAMVTAAEERVRAADPDALLTETGRSAVEQLDQAIVTGGGPIEARAAQTLYDRDRRMFQNITEPLRRRLAPGSQPFDPKLGGDFQQSMSNLREIQQKAGSPLYELAFNRGIPHTSAELERIFRTPAVQRAWRRAQVAMANDPDMTPEMLAQARGADGRPSLRGWQYIKRQLDQSTRQARSGANPRPEDERIFRNLTGRLLDELDRLQPSYGEARNVWAGTKAAEDAMQAGYDFMSTSKLSQFPVAELRRMNDSERQFFKVGIMGYFEDLLGRVPLTHDLTKRFDTPAMRRRLGVVFDTREEVDDFYNVLEAEATKARAKKVLGGSPTARRLTEQSAWEEAQDLAQLAQSTGFGTALNVGRRALTVPPRRPTAMGMATDVSDMLLETDPARQREILERLARRRPLVLPPTAPGAIAGPVGATGGLLGWER